MATTYSAHAPTETPEASVSVRRMLDEIHTKGCVVTSGKKQVRVRVMSSFVEHVVVRDSHIPSVSRSSLPPSGVRVCIRTAQDTLTCRDAFATRTLVLLCGCLFQ